MDPLDLDALPEPLFAIRFDGQIRTYDPFEIIGKLEVNPVLSNTTGGKVTEQVEEIRKLFGFTGEKVPSAAQCMRIITSFLEYVREIPEIKKLQSLMPK